MVPNQLEANTPTDELSIKQASAAALAALLNLTFLPVLSFLWLFIKKSNAQSDLAKYHFSFGIKLNIYAAIALLVVSTLMIIFGGFDSAWTWVYVITYFTFVHTVFIVIAVWALTKAWSGKTL